MDRLTVVPARAAAGTRKLATRTPQIPLTSRKPNIAARPRPARDKNLITAMLSAHHASGSNSGYAPGVRQSTSAGGAWQAGQWQVPVRGPLDRGLRRLPL